MTLRCEPNLEGKKNIALLVVKFPPKKNVTTRLVFSVVKFQNSSTVVVNLVRLFSVEDMVRIIRTVQNNKIISWKKLVYLS